MASAPEIFQRVLSDILAGLPDVAVYIDDILIIGKDMVEHDQLLGAVLHRLQAANLTLNWAKCLLRQSRIKYLGHWISAQGVSPDPEELHAIADMPSPKDITDVRRFLGMITYLGKFIPSLSQSTEPLRQLAKREPFQVDNKIHVAFNTAKEGAVSALAELAFFQTDTSIPTAISCNASPLGLGAVLWQTDKSNQWLPVSCASRSLTDTESRYSQIERELPGVVFALNRFRQYVLGRHVTVYTDHKPLIPLVQKAFDDVPPRLQRWLVALMSYDYSLMHLPGKDMVCADALSRAPLPDQSTSPAESRSMDEFISFILEECPVNMSDIQRATQEDTVLSSVLTRVLTSAWDRCTRAEEPFYLVRDQLTVIDGVLVLNNRYVIPDELQLQVLRRAHEGHPGSEAFKSTLRAQVWWPTLSKDASQFAESCSECWRRRSHQHQELQSSEIEGVWVKLPVDLVTVEGRQLLSVIDYGSRYPEVVELSSTNSAGVINKFMEVFARFGLPSTLVSDNGPQFASEEMKTFVGQLGIEHIKSSPRYPRSNGMVERFHRVLKERIKSLQPHLPFQRRLQQVLFDIRHSVHRMIGATPVDALFSRPIRNRVPTVIPTTIINPVHQIRAKADMASAHDPKRGIRSLPQLLPGTLVILQDGYADPRKKWTVVEQYGRQVGVMNGKRILLRSRQQVCHYLTPLASPRLEESRIPDQNLASIGKRSVSTTPTLASSLPNRLTPGSEHAAKSSLPATDHTVELEDSTSVTPPGHAPECEETPAPGTSSNATLSAPSTVVVPSNPKSSSIFKENIITRSACLVKLTSKAQESCM